MLPIKKKEKNMFYIKAYTLPPIRADTVHKDGGPLLLNMWLKMENLDSRKNNRKLMSLEKRKNV